MASAHINNCLDANKAAPKASTSKTNDLSSFRKTFTASSSKLDRKGSSDSSKPDLKGKGKAADQSGNDGKPTAFTALMTGHAEDKAWKVAEQNEKIKVCTADLLYESV